MLKLNISKAISMRPRKGPRNRGTKKGISSKGGRGKSECRGSGRPPVQTVYPAPKAYREHHALSARALPFPGRAFSVLFAAAS